VLSRTQASCSRSSSTLLLQRTCAAACAARSPGAALSRALCALVACCVDHEQAALQML
jgi:hypothetical protein